MRNSFVSTFIISQNVVWRNLKVTVSEIFKRTLEVKSVVTTAKELGEAVIFNEKGQVFEVVATKGTMTNFVCGEHNGGRR